VTTSTQQHNDKHVSVNIPVICSNTKITDWRRCPLPSFPSSLPARKRFLCGRPNTLQYGSCRSDYRYPSAPDRHYATVWLNGLVVSTLGIGARGPRFDSWVVPLFHWVATLGKFTHIASAVSQLQETGVQKGSFRRLSGYGD